MDNKIGWGVFGRPEARGERLHRYKEVDPRWEQRPSALVGYMAKGKMTLFSQKFPLPRMALRS